MNIARLAVRRPVGVTTLVFSLFLFGAIALSGLGLDFLPKLEYPVVMVATVYPGADPTTIETTVTMPLEDAISTVPGLRRLRSTSQENVSLIAAEFDWGADITEAVDQLETRVDIAHRFLPAQVEAPVILKTDPDQLPLMLIAISGNDDAISTTHLAEHTVKYRIEQIPGVASAQILGGEREEISVEYDSSALIEHGLTPSLMQQALAAQNVIVPAGTIVQDGRRYSILAGQRFETLEALRNQTIAIQSGQNPGVGLLGFASAMPIRLRDVADIGIIQTPREGYTRVNQQPAVVIQVLKQSGANSTGVADALLDSLKEMESELGLSFHVLTNQTDLINVSLSNLTSAGIVGGLLAVLVLSLFLKEITSILIIGIAIPLSIMAALIALYFMGITLNIMSLGGLALSVGMLVDSAIVVLENISRRRSLGESPKQAASEGGREISGALLASTVTTLVVFIPLLFLRSLVGVLFKETGLAVTVSLVASLLIALTVIPMAASRFRSRSHTRSKSMFNVKDRTPDDQTPFAYQRYYKRVLEYWTSRPWHTATLLPILILLSIWLPGTLTTEFLPKTDGGIVTARFTLPPGTTIDDSERFTSQLEAQLLKLPEVSTVFSLSGDQGSSDLLARAQSLSPNEVQMTVILHPRENRKRSVFDVADEIMQFPFDPDITVRIESDRTSEALGDDFFAGLTLQVTGPDHEVIRDIVYDITNALQADGRFRHPISNVQDGPDELFFRITERSFQGARSGGEPLTAGFVGLSLRNHLVGLPATDITIDGRTYPVVLRPQSSETDDIEAIKDFRVPGSQLSMAATASPLILERISDISQQTSQAALHRVNRSRSAQVRAELDTIGFAEAKRWAEALTTRLDIPDGYKVQVSGLHQVIDESIGELVWMLLIAFTLVYMVMAIQFESFFQPLIIIITVPLAAVGALGALKLFGHAIGIPAFIGFLLLVGISVNNGILMIDLINQSRSRGTPYRTAVIQGAVQRIRPILMTILTTILGLVPLAFGWGEGSELLAPLAVCVIGGLFSSTVLTLFVLPGILLFRKEQTPSRPASPGRRGTHMATFLLVSILTVGGLSGGKALAASSSWHGSLVTGIEVDERWDDHYLPLYGGTIGYEYRAVTVEGQWIRYGIGGDSQNTLGLLVGYLPPTKAWSQLQLQTVMERPGSFYHVQGSGDWISDTNRGHLSISYTRGAARHWPWSAVTAPVGWSVQSRYENVIGSGTTWERQWAVSAHPARPPTWMLLTGPKWNGPGWRALVQGALMIDPVAHPLLNVGIGMSVGPQTEIDLLFAPYLDRAPIGWPLARASLTSQPLGKPVRAEARWIVDQPGIFLETQWTLVVTPTSKLDLSWSTHPSNRSFLTYQIQF